MRQITATGPTVDAAVKQALMQLNTSIDKVNIEVIEAGKKGFFGLFGYKQAIIEVTQHPDPVEETKAFLQKVIQQMGMAAEITVSQKGKDIFFDLTGEKVAILIGKRGQTLNALQYLTQQVASKVTNQYVNIIVDAENYRQKRKETLENLAIRFARQAIDTKQFVQLEPMTAAERKIIHHILMKNKQVETYSDGHEPNRYVTIKPL